MEFALNLPLTSGLYVDDTYVALVESSMKGSMPRSINQIKNESSF